MRGSAELPLRAVAADDAGGAEAAGGEAEIGAAAAPEFAAMGELRALRRLGAGPRGLVEAEADRRLFAGGENLLPPQLPRRWTRWAATALGDPYTVTLMLLAGVTAIAGALTSTVVLLVLTCAAAVLRFVGERSADRGSGAVAPDAREGTATVVRRAHEGARPVARELPFDLFVPGDTVRLAAGDQLPADVLLLSSKGLALDQSVLTGETLPVPRHAAGLVAGSVRRGTDRRTAAVEDPRLCLRGSRVVQGTATGVVVATGVRTHLADQARPRVPSGRATVFDGAARSVARLLLAGTVFSAVAAVGVEVAVNGGGWPLLPYAAAVAVGLTPEMLALVVTTVLARAARRLRGAGVAVRRLSAVHDLGSLDVLCADKTGTLTRDRLRLVTAVDAEGDERPEVAHWAALASLMAMDLGDPPLLDAVDEALLDQAFADDPEFGARTTGLAVVPFDPVQRLAGAVVREPGRLGCRTVIVKGAVEEVLARCSHERLGAETGETGEAPLDDRRRERVVALADARAEAGLRVLAVAVRDLPARGGDVPGVLPRSGLTLLGLVGLEEEAEPGALRALADLAADGVVVKIVTGDRPGSALRACRAAGLAPGVPLLGREVDVMDEEALRRAAGSTTVFALASPAHKARIVRALRASGHRVGFLGDGANDLPALHAADVSLSVPQALEAPRSRSDLVLTAAGPAGLGEAVRAARNALANMSTYVRITVASNLGNVLSMLVAGLWLPFLPMLPSQVLVQNLCFDAAQLSLAFDRPTTPGGTRPAVLDGRGLARFVVVFGVVNTFADLLVFAVLHRLGHGWNAPRAQLLFHSGWFTENLVTQALTVHVLRTAAGGVRAPAAWPVRWANLGLVAVGVLLPLSPLGEPLGLGALPFAFYPLLGAVLVVYGAALVAVRRLFRA
ncbi:Mg2+-importing ATPase [Streptacidiphilus sp. MAP12-33]|uniref:HAD-IC family P-type ATPase n=1 Tax=Streptacidiphilus sp. MAP12-33 TaxID=3156266 RepID=UPI00351422AC